MDNNENITIELTREDIGLEGHYLVIAKRNGMVASALTLRWFGLRSEERSVEIATKDAIQRLKMVEAEQSKVIALTEKANEYAKRMMR